MNVSIIGSGHMARGIGTRLVVGGHNVTFYDRKPESVKLLADDLKKSARGGQTVEAKVIGDPLTGDVVVAALPYAAVGPVVTELKDQLAGKILVDICNPINFQTFEFLTPAGSSGSEEIAKAAPKTTKVVKAFNTTFSGTLVTGSVKGMPLDVFIAGDDAEAKKVVSQLVQDGGLRPLDAGPLSHARGLEGFMLINMSLQQALGTKFMSAIKIIG